MLVVMHFRAVSRHATAGEPAEAIAHVQRQAQAFRNYALLPADELIYIKFLALNPAC